MDMPVGTKLNNGATVLAFEPYRSCPASDTDQGGWVLAFRPYAKYHPFVTWRVNGAGQPCLGHYFAALEYALHDLGARRMNHHKSGEVSTIS